MSSKHTVTIGSREQPWDNLWEEYKEHYEKKRLKLIKFKVKILKAEEIYEF